MQMPAPCRPGHHGGCGIANSWAVEVPVCQPASGCRFLCKMPNIGGWLAQGVGELPEMGGELRIGRDGRGSDDRWWRAATLGVAWVAVVLTYAMAVIGFSRRPFGYAITQGLISVTLASLLGYWVWRI